MDYELWVEEISSPYFFFFVQEKRAVKPPFIKFIF